MTNLLVLLGIIVAVSIFTRMSGNPMGHSPTFMRRQVFDLVPLGVTYALLYMGRYNLTVRTASSWARR